ncbi:MAG: hypothetical protein OXG27_09335 [Chloroflexi bacterium]|nr:hypothetical protein [Chloroflexota bacterium]
MITLDTVATLGTWDDSGIPIITPFSRVAVDHRGRFLITHLTYPAISVFAPNGEFLGIVGRGADRRGEGARPGTGGSRPREGGDRTVADRQRPVEFDAIAHVNVGPRFIHVFDFRRGRIVLDQNFEVVRTDPSLGRVLSSVVLDTDQVAFAVPAAEPATVGHRLHILDLGGRTRQFGGDSQLDQGPQLQRFVVAGDDRSVWVVSQQSNRLVRWDLDPTPAVARVFDRTVEPFESHNPPTEIWPRSLNVGSMLDEGGLWIAWQTPDPEWTERISPGGPIPEAPWQTVLDGWLDLIDPATGRTIARYHGDDALLGFANGSRYVVSYHEPDAGGSYIRVLEPRLSRVSSDM